MLDVKEIIYEKNNNSLIISVNNEESIIKNDYILKKINNQLVFKYLESLYRIINNWEKEYVNTKIIDGNSWKLSIIYIGGNKVEYVGKSSYPNNFETFERLNQELIYEV